MTGSFGSLDKFDEWDNVVTGKLKRLKNMEAIRSCMLRIGEWPSYPAEIDGDDDDNETPSAPFVDEEDEDM